MIQNRLRVAVVIALAIGAASCAEPDAPAAMDTATTLALTPRFGVVEEGPQDPPPGTPPEYQGPTTLDVDASAAFVGSTASGESLVHYFGTDATAEATISITRGSVSYGTPTGATQDSHVVPALWTLSASAAKLLPGSCGFIVNTTARGSVWIETPPIPPLPASTFGKKKDTEFSAAQAPACPPPKARLLASYGGLSGTVLNLTIPEDQSIVVGLSASGSAPGQSGGPPITSYAWFANGTSLGGGVSRNLGLISSKSLVLTVTDEMHATGSATGAINISYTNPCDDPRTHIVETCEDGGGGGGGGSGLVGMGGSSRDIGDYHHAPGGTYVCYFTDWYQWSGSTWVYQFTELDYCDIE